MSTPQTSGHLSEIGMKFRKRSAISRFSLLEGFSLMEVTISLSIVAFVAVPMMALISSALTSNRDSADRAVISQIVDQVAREVEQANFNDLPSEFPVASFDERGVRLEENDSRQIFIARAKVVKEAEIPISGGGLPSPNLAMVLIDVAPNPSNRPDSELFQEEPEGGLSNPLAQRFSILVSRDD